MKIKSEQYYINKLKGLKNETSFRQHSEADCILCDFLRQLGYEELVNEYVKISKYYHRIGDEWEEQENIRISNPKWLKYHNL